jgi:hypothetical protein
VPLARRSFLRGKVRQKLRTVTALHPKTKIDIAGVSAIRQHNESQNLRSRAFCATELSIDWPVVSNSPLY